MAELLIKAIDATHTDSAKDAFCYKRGDVVVVMPDGHEWGREEGLPAFLRISVPSVATEEISSLIFCKTSPFETDADGDPVDTARRRYSLDVDLLGFIDGVVVIDKATLMSILKVK